MTVTTGSRRTPHRAVAGLVAGVDPVAAVLVSVGARAPSDGEGGR